MKTLDSFTLLKQYFLQFKGNLFKGFIHNLSSPLQNIGFLLEFMKEDLDPLAGSQLKSYCSEKRKLLQLQFSSISNMAISIRQLDYMAGEDTPVIIDGFMKIIKEILRFNLFFKHHVELEIDTSENVQTSIIPGKVFVPVICQLLDNALKALRTTSKTKKLRIVVNSESVQIVDNGCGLHHIDNVEEVFDYGTTKWPVEIALEDDIVSAGLGLYWVKKVLNDLNCDISLFMDDSSFTVAKIIFPRKEEKIST